MFTELAKILGEYRPENATTGAVDLLQDISLMMSMHVSSVTKASAGLLVLVRVLTEKGIIDPEKDLVPLDEWSQQAAADVNRDLIQATELLNQWVLDAKAAQTKAKSASA